MRWVRELAVPGCHWSAQGLADQYQALNVETDTAGPAPDIKFSPVPASDLDIDGNLSLADQVWAAGRDLDVDDFQMPTMSQLSVSFAFATLCRNTQTDQLVVKVTNEFELADSKFTMNLDAEDFEHLCEGLLGVEPHRCSFRSLCGVLVTCPSTLLKLTCSHTVTLLKKCPKDDGFSLVLGTLLLNTRAMRAMENVATPSQAGTLDWLEYFFAEDLGDRCILLIRLFETHVDADCHYMGTQTSTPHSLRWCSFPTRGTCMVLDAPGTVFPIWLTAKVTFF